MCLVSSSIDMIEEYISNPNYSFCFLYYYIIIINKNNMNVIITK